MVFGVFPVCVWAFEVVTSVGSAQLSVVHPNGAAWGCANLVTPRSPPALVLLPAKRQTLVVPCALPMLVVVVVGCPR